MLLRGLALPALASILVAAPARSQCSSSVSTSVNPPTGLVPLDDLGAGTYSNPADPTMTVVQGGLYPGGVSCVPAAHASLLATEAAAIVPLDVNGNPLPPGQEHLGSVVLLSIGASVSSQSFSAFERRMDLIQHRPEFVVLNGAQGGQTTDVISNKHDVFWQRILNRLAAAGLDRRQVQMVWIGPALSAGSALSAGVFPGHVHELQNQLETIVRFLKEDGSNPGETDKFPNLRLCYLSGPPYRGWTTIRAPVGYESAFGIRWLIEDQINGDPLLSVAAGRAPVLVWGPYLWADGLNARTGVACPATLSSSVGAGLTWPASHFETDGLHPGTAGENEVAQMFREFFGSSPATARWFVPKRERGSLLAVDASADAYVDAASPTTNFGDVCPLELDQPASGAEKIAYVEFQVAGVTSSDVVHAKLSLRHSALVNLHQDLLPIDVGVLDPNDDWDETTVAWITRPAGTFLATLPGADADATRSLDVTAAVRDALDQHGGVLGFALRRPDGGPDGPTRIYSRESSYPFEPARLVLRLRPDPAPASYCTAGTSASGCRATIAASGTPSASAASGFEVSAAGVEGGATGIFYWGTNGRQSNPWGNGTSFQCVVPPVTRGGLLPGAGTPGACDGSLALDLNALWCPGCPKPQKNPGAGAVIQTQLWYRDPFNTSNQTTSFSDALEVFVGS